PLSCCATHSLLSCFSPPLPAPLAPHSFPTRRSSDLFTERNALFSDPLMTNGTRGYIPEDSMRDIHWKASAKTGELQTRLYDKMTDRKSTRLNSSHVSISYAVFCLKKKNIYEDAARAD